MFSQHRLLWPGHTGVSGRDGIEKDADSRAKGIRGVGRQGLMKSVLVRSLEALRYHYSI